MYKPPLPATYTPSSGRPPDLFIPSFLQFGFSLLETVSNPACNFVGFSFQDNTANPAWDYITDTYIPPCGRPPDLLIPSPLQLGFSLLETVPNPACNLVGISFQDKNANPAWDYITATYTPPCGRQPDLQDTNANPAWDYIPATYTPPCGQPPDF